MLHYDDEGDEDERAALGLPHSWNPARVLFETSGDHTPTGKIGTTGEKTRMAAVLFRGREFSESNGVAM